MYEASKFIDKVRTKAILRVMEDKKIIISKFLEEDSYIQKEILYYLLSDFYQDDLILLGDKHIELILKFIHSKKANGFINLPNQVIVMKKYHYIELARETEK